METFDFLDELVIICTAAVAVILVFNRFRIPPIIGLIATGILLGPSGLGIITQDEIIHTISELGVVMLLFTIGLEFSLEDLRKLRSIVLIGGPLQIAASTTVIGGGAWLIASWTGHPMAWQNAIMIGMAMALSSTAICTKLLKDRRELGLPHGRAVMGILIFQDIAVVPLMIAVTLLAPNSELTGTDIAIKLGTLVGVAGGLIVGMRVLMPKIVGYVARVSAQEILILGGLGLCFGAAWITSSVGISMALGAFIAGVAIAGSDEGHAIGRVLEPMRDAFTSVFFVSVGLLLVIDYGSLFGNILTAIAVLVANAVIVILILMGLRLPTRVAVMAGVVLAQVGEFSFVLATAGLNSGLLTTQDFQNMLVSIIFTMIVTPSLIAAAPGLAEQAAPAVRFVPLLRWFMSSKEPEAIDVDAPVSGPTVTIVGAGVLGTNVARVLKATGISYSILELNGNTVAKLRADGEPIFQGDLTDTHSITSAGLLSARAVIVAISDQTALAHGIRVVRSLRPDVHIIARTRYALESDRVSNAGADVVITEEYESSIQVFVSLLGHLGIAESTIQEQEDMMRQDHYGLLGRVTNKGASASMA